jgi:hypothetical protein
MDPDLGKRSVVRWRARTIVQLQGAEEGHMNPDVLVPLIPIVAIVAIAAVKIARVRATRPESLSTDVTARFEALERVVQDLQHELTETQERLDFAERLLGKAREERRIGS